VWNENELFFSFSHRDCIALDFGVYHSLLLLVDRCTSVFCFCFFESKEGNSDFLCQLLVFAFLTSPALFLLALFSSTMSTVSTSTEYDYLFKLLLIGDSVKALEFFSFFLL
jgi:hypothetical protein